MIGSLKTSDNDLPGIADPHNTPIHFIDWIVASGFGPAPGIINIALAAIDHTQSGRIKEPVAVLQTRLRMSAQTAQSLIGAIQSALDGLKPPTLGQTVN